MKKSKKSKAAESKPRLASKRGNLQRAKKIQALIDTVFRLRAPGGCPWDRAQTHESLRPFLIEEAYELLDILDQISSAKDLRRSKKLREDFREELGDVLLQVILHAEMAAQEKIFDIYDVAEALNEKLIRRHPHVFGKEKGKMGADAAFRNWEREKAKEKLQKKRSGADASVLSGLPKQLPALQRAARVIEKVTKVGFQWPDMEGPLAKVEEEFRELKAEIQAYERAPSEPLLRRMEAELGDLLFCVANLGYLLKIQPEQALRGNLDRFERRFRFVESELEQLGKKPADSNLEEMDEFWRKAKQREKALAKEKSGA